MPNPNRTIAYLSLEIGLDAALPTYSGGLGVLAGDTVRAAADLGLPFAAVTLLYREGYFTQSFDEHGMQVESPTPWDPDALLEELPHRVYVPIEGRMVYVRAYRRMVEGATGHRVPVYFLDTDLPENAEQDRSITHALYAGDTDHRIKQAAVLGIAGRRMLRAVTHDCVVFHLNEGHGFLLTLELMSEYLSRYETFEVTPGAVEYVKRQCVFTTHTPVEAGHDRFDIGRVRAIVGEHPLLHRPDLYGSKNTLNTTVLALNLSRYANGVALKHGEVSRLMFPGHPIDAITNGVHAATWTGPHMAALFDRYLPGWRIRSSELRNAERIPLDEVRAAHGAAKHNFVMLVNRTAGTSLEPDAFTICFARRATAYKRPELLFTDPPRLDTLAEKYGPIQLVFAGKAHPHDGRGKEILKLIRDSAKKLNGRVHLALVPNYDIASASLCVAGADLWLNNPTPPMEASGTSGMKAALNGVPSLSTLDGWWIEGCVEGVTGWAIEGNDADPGRLAAMHANSMYTQLEHAILPLYRDDPDGWARVMRSSIALNGSYFSTQRMVRDYVLRAYLY